MFRCTPTNYAHAFRGALLTLLVATITPMPLHAQSYQAGQMIEYKVRGAVPEKWEQGVIIRELPGGKQYLIHEKPSQFFPKGPEVAYAPEELRRPQPTGKTPDPAVKGNPTVPQPPAADPTGKDPTPAPAGKGLLSKEEVLAYAKQLFGPGDPFAHPRRDALLAQIRDTIKTRGTNFLTDLAFDNQMGAQGTSSVNINAAINANHGPAPKLEDYIGTFLLRTANRGSKTAKPDGSKILVTTTDSQHESGKLTINKDGTYVWEVLRGDPADKWLRGKWREVKTQELTAWEGGPAIWLEKAKQGQDYMVRMSRVPGWPGWIDVGMNAARTPVEYGRQP